ncbi:hypothetical protein [Methylobacterium sp. Gmos1]
MTDDWTTRGRSLRAEAQQARHTKDETGTSPVERQAIREMMEAEWAPVLDDTGITPSAEPHQTAERVTSRPLTSFDF